jgi:hypothetical protein
MSSKKSSVAGVLKGFRFEQPFMGFSTKFRTVPYKDKGAPQVHAMNYGASCREELIWDAREYLQSKTVTYKQKPGTWENVATLQRIIDIDDRSLKQPFVTYFWFSGEDDYDGSYNRATCMRPCCAARFPEVMDALVGTLGVALNPNRYVGDWWRTSPEEANKGNGDELRWYGTDNFFLRHPVLTSLMMGMFRQAFLLFQQGFDTSMLTAINRKEVEGCLTDSDSELAMRILTKLKPWIAAKSPMVNLPFPSAHWERLRLLHRAAYNHGYDALFGPDIHKAWNLSEKSDKSDHGNYNERYDITTGPSDYFVEASRGKKNPSALRLRLLGK